MEEAVHRFAEESDKTKKVRRKLHSYFQNLEGRITQQGLAHKITEIHGWISRHAHHRVSIKSKSFSLFDENQNTARTSRRVNDLLAEIKKHLKDQEST